MTKTEDYVADLCWQLKALSLPEPQLEHRFHPERRWRFDLAWPDRKIALEVDGGTWVKGRHTTGVGVYNDSVKFNEAAILGWRVLRVVPNMIRDGEAAKFVERVLR